MHILRLARTITAALYILCPSVRGEMWSTLEDYVGKCVVIVKAKTVAEDGEKREFEVAEVWKGNTDILPLDTKRRYIEWQGHHGVDVIKGQEIIFFFTRQNQPAEGKLVSHGTAFPIKDGKLVYARTAEPGGLRQEFTVEDFKKRVLEVMNQQSKTTPNKSVESTPTR